MNKVTGTRGARVDGGIREQGEGVCGRVAWAWRVRIIGATRVRGIGAVHGGNPGAVGVELKVVVCLSPTNLLFINKETLKQL